MENRDASINGIRMKIGVKWPTGMEDIGSGDGE